ncbi:MAG: hypothetical protein WB502_09010 [Thermoactinomyces sp.]
MKNRGTIPGHLLHDIYNDSDLQVHYLIDSYEEWKQIWRQVPVEVTNCLETLGLKYRHDQHLMNQKQKEILADMKKHFPEIWAYFHPNGEFSKVHWDYANSAFWCRLQFKKQGICEQENAQEAIS